MTRTLLLLALLALPLTGCPPSLGDDDDAVSDDDDSMDDDDVADDDDLMDDDDLVDDDDDNTTDPVDDDDATDPDDDDTRPDDDDATGPDDDDVVVIEATPVEICDQSVGNDFQLGSWTIVGDILDATVSYSGGCAVHDFRACWDTLFMESNPVQVNLLIKDLGPPDACLAFITEQVQFDLQLLQDEWIQSYGPAPGEIIVNIDGGSQSYTF